MVKKFVGYIPRVLEDWEKAYKEHDMVGIGGLAHKLLGSVRTFRLKDVNDQLREIELACDRGESFTSIQELYKHCFQRIKRAIAKIEEDQEG